MILNIPSRKSAIISFKEKNGNIAAVFPIHYPRALLRAFNILPVEVWGPPKVDRSLGNSQIQTYVCSIVQNSFSFLQAGGLNDCDLLLIPHTCDSLQGFAGLIKDFIPLEKQVLTLYLPRGQRQSDLEFISNEFRSLYHSLSEITGLKPDSKTMLAFQIEEEKANDLLKKLYLNKHTLSLADEEFYTLIRCREYLPAEEFSNLVEEALNNNSTPSSSHIPIMLSGIVPESMTLFSILNSLGAKVVADDFACCGRRVYPSGTSDEPFLRMAESIQNSPPDSTRGHSIESRGKYLLNEIKRSGAKGFIFFDINFCEPELFDLPILTEILKENNIPVLTLLIDISDTISEQIKTRIQAFLELIQ